MPGMTRLLSLAVLLPFLVGDVYMSSPVATTWLYATILIENEWGGRGTGFLVAREVKKDQVKVFLCTNKHVLNEEKALREKATKIVCHLNVKDKNGKIVGRAYELPLKINGKRRWNEHPEKNVDVLVFDVTDLIVKVPEIEKKWATYSLFADPSVLAEQDITIGEEVMVIGYPLGFRQGKTNSPIVRQGIVASQIGQRFVEEFVDKNKKQYTREYRGFLVDGGMVPGSSGSPVILKPVTGRHVHGTIVMGTVQPYLLGIVAETRYAPIPAQKGAIGYAGLGLAFDALTVKETIELFFK